MCTERAELEIMFADLNEPAILTVSHIVMSSDLTHDAAMVQHCNDKILLPWMEQIKAPGVTWKRHHARSDGCKAQFKCGTIFLWISSFFKRHGVHLEWNFFCSCHGRYMPDPECGTDLQNRCQESRDEAQGVKANQDSDSGGIKGFL
jgi:hypothetical protein